MNGIDWGDAPTWCAGVFAAAAAWYTRGMLNSQRQQIEEQRAFIAEQSTNLALERAELRAQAEERRRAQALQVQMDAQWIESDPEYGDAVSEALWRVIVSSHSPEPLRDVTVRFGDAYNPARAYDASGGAAPTCVPVFGANRRYRFLSPNSMAMANQRPVLFFTDNAGVRWRLDEHGELSEAVEE